ncbi:hypothetical protein B0T16DRAFT_335342 [Cercophora newfieldiana]|uniref:Uncharacterized protein n=1 Tax=Cercophora newfieldiana TaxID=92897 RepID=A0AA39XXB2_9PEZI|nr:hypothetical protein B0T16DRAFT_335342 [Cercophora newfieldiana]
MAIGALASSKAPDVLMPEAKDARNASQHYQKALDFYGRALGLVRLQQDVLSDYTLRIAIICCVLFACFEAVHDSCDASISHIRHGLMMSPPQGVSPTAFVLDDEILRVFQRMEYLAFCVSLLQGLPPPSRIFLCLSEQFDLSRPFTDLIQARRCLDQFQHACMRATIAKPASTSVPLAPLEDWHRAFMPLASQLTRSGTNNLAYYQAISLLLQYHIAHTSLALLPYATNDSLISVPPIHHVLEGLTPHYKEMLRLAETLMACEPRADPRKRIFTMDHEPALAVFMTATGCADQSARAEALAMLDRYPQRDGFWDRRRIVRCHGPAVAMDAV